MFFTVYVDDMNRKRLYNIFCTVLYRSSNAIGPQIKMHIFYTTAKTKFRKRFFLIFHHLYVIIKHVNMSLDVFLSALSIRNMNIYITPSHEAENAQKSLLYSKF